MPAKRKAAKPRKLRINRQKPVPPASLANLIPFVKDDPRINRKGRPRTLAELRETIQAMGAEPISDQLTRLDLLLRSMYSGWSATDRKTILEYGWGKIVQPFTVEDNRSDSELVTEFRKLLDIIATGAGAVGDHDASGTGQPARADGDPADSGSVGA